MRITTCTIKLKQLAKTRSINPKDPTTNGKYYKMLNKYKRECKKAKNDYQKGLLIKLQNMENSNSKKKCFWKAVKDLQMDSSNTEHVDPSEFFMHFKALSEDHTSSNECFDKDFKKHIDHDLTILESNLI